jgi:pimeloyl-ACP methyl ester carboxylesterase
VIKKQPEYTDRLVTASGIDLYTRRRTGSQHPPLLLINGLGGSLTSWDALVEWLPDRDVIMVDTPGSGRSQTPRLPLRVPQLADLIAEATRSLGVEKVDVLGFSLGGTIAQEFARRHPGMVRKLVLVGTFFGIGSRPVPFRVQKTLLSTARYRDRALMERDMPRLAGGLTARDPEVLASLLDARESHPPTPRGYYYQQLAVIGWSSWYWLKRLSCPTLVLHGGADPVVPKVNARLLAHRIPDSRLEIIDHAGHLVLFDEPDKAGPIIDRFLSD